MLRYAIKSDWVDDAARHLFALDPSQKLRTDVLRHPIRVSENVS